MKEVKRFTKRMLAVMLSGTLMVGNLSVSAFAAENVVDFGTTSEVVIEEKAEKSVEEGGLETDFADTGYITEEASTSETSSEITGEDPAIAPADEENDPVASYTVTLDANGGYFDNEWDDVLGEYVEKTEIVKKIIPVGEQVNIIPLKVQMNTAATFLGWSLERYGEIVNQVNEPFYPDNDCTLFAIWSEESEDIESEQSDLSDSVEYDGYDGDGQLFDEQEEVSDINNENAEVQTSTDQVDEVNEEKNSDNEFDILNEPQLDEDYDYLQVGPEEKTGNLTNNQHNNDSNHFHHRAGFLTFKNFLHNDHLYINTQL